MMHRTVRGRIRYTSKKPEMLDAERGREWFSFTHHGDGSAILNAHCEIEEPAPTVMRDIIYAIGPDGRPRNLHVHLVVGDVFMGSGWLNLAQGEQGGDGGRIECESAGPSIGRVSQRLDFTGALDGFGTHPIVGDGYFDQVHGRGTRPASPHDSRLCAVARSSRCHSADRIGGRNRPVISGR